MYPYNMRARLSGQRFGPPKNSTVIAAKKAPV